jgi:hypothetical protein
VRKRIEAGWAGFGIGLGFGPNWLGKIEIFFLFSNLYIKCKSIWIQNKFKLWMTSTHKIKYKSTSQHKGKYASAW